MGFRIFCSIGVNPFSAFEKKKGTIKIKNNNATIFNREYFIVGLSEKKIILLI